EVQVALPMRVRIDQAAPAASIERRPVSLRLTQAIGHRMADGRVMAHAAMAALDFDALGARGGLLHAALPGADAIGAAEDRGGRYRRRPRQCATETRILFVSATAACHLIDAPGVGRLRAGCKGTAERDHGAHALRHHLGELPRVET